MAFLWRKNGIQFLMTTFMLRVKDFFLDNSNIPTRRGKKVDLNTTYKGEYIA